MWEILLLHVLLFIFDLKLEKKPVPVPPGFAPCLVLIVFPTMGIMLVLYTLALKGSGEGA